METELTAKDKITLEKLARKRELNRLRQERYRNKLKEINEDEFKANQAEYQRNYRKKIKEEENKVKGIINKIEEKPKEINIQEIIKPPPLSKKQKRYSKKNNITTDIIPSYQTRKEALEPSTIIEYLRKINIIHKLITYNPLSIKLKSEINNLINNNDFSEDYIINNMPYLNDIEKTITTIRNKYPADNSFKSYLVPLAVVLSHIQKLNNNYQILTKVAKNINEGIQNIRMDNVLPKEDQKKIINDMDEKILMKNVNKLIDIKEKLIYGIYTLFPTRREDDYRLMRITYNIRAEDADDNYNYLQILKNGKMKFIFNEYKTNKTYKQQIYNVPENLTKIFNSYINQNSLKELDYLFYSNNDKRDKMGQSNFSQKISATFKKIYDIPININYIRKSYSNHIHKIAYENRLSTKEEQKLIEMMAHSIQEHNKYRALRFE